MTQQKVFQVRYTNSRQSVDTFWAQDVWKIRGSFRFTGCRTLTTRLLNITVPTTMKPTITECDQPDWWKRD